jgi:hypothetical protein
VTVPPIPIAHHTASCGILTEISPKASPAIHAFTSLFAYSHCYARSICSPTRTGNKAD